MIVLEEKIKHNVRRIQIKKKRRKEMEKIEDSGI